MVPCCPPVRIIPATTLQSIGEIGLHRATLALENTLGKQTVTTRTRIRHLSIFSRILLQTPLKPIPVLCLLELARWATLVQEFQLGVVWLVPEEVECVALCLFSSYACCLPFFTRSRRPRHPRLRPHPR